MARSSIRLSWLFAALIAAAATATSLSVAQTPAGAPPVNAPGSATAGKQDVLENSQISISYDPPKTYLYQGVYNRLKARHVLEEFRRFLAPLRLPNKLPVQTTECGVANSWYESTSGVTICYEFIDWMERVAPSQPQASGLTPEDAIVGPFIQVIFHELGHAVFDRLKVPIMGREEDAADQFAGYIMLMLGKDVAKRTLPGAAYFWAATATPYSKTDFADVHGDPVQRSYNYLCMAYGGYPDEFANLVDIGLLPKSRAALCGYEYKLLALAFSKTISPYMDENLLKVVQSRNWLRPNDGTIPQ